MKAGVFLTAVLGLLLIFISGAVWADAGPHGGYAATTDACATCHRTHTAPGARLLNSDATGNEFCYTCHNGTGAPATPVVSTHSNVDFLEGVEEPFTLACTQCHNPHGNSGALYSIKEFVQVRTGDPQVTTGPIIFTAITGINSYDDGVSDPTSRLCVTCHENSANSGYPMVNHTGGANHQNGADYTGEDCTSCHAHSTDTDLYTRDGFMASCTACHGQPPDGDSAPNRAGSHATHFAPTAFGPQLTPGICNDCHAFSAATHNDGEVTFTDGRPLATTNACNNCHSPGGTYDGVNDAVYGAKANWDTGVYTGGNLITGREKWCAACHDENPANSLTNGSGVTAPNVVGDEDDPYFYGTGWGYYKTGHGLALGAYPASEAPAANLACLACHDANAAHIDQDVRTYTAVSDNYQTGYRLRYSMDIPRTDGGTPASDFDLCFQCHNSGPFLTETNLTTNFRHDPDSRNSHWYHLQTGGAYTDRWDSDWDCDPADPLGDGCRANGDSQLSCTACHNVHGSPSPVMMRHGELISTSGTRDKTPSVDFQYIPAGTYPTLPNSTGGIIRFIAPGPGSIAKNGICSMCHSDQVEYTRTPTNGYAPRIVNVFGRNGSDQVLVNFSKGVYSEWDATGDLMPGDFTLTDADNGRIINSVSHTAGEAQAVLTLSAPLDGSDDVGIDTLSAASAASIYDDAGNAMAVIPVIITDDTDPPVASDLAPPNGVVDLPVNSDLTFTLSDSGSGVDWATFTIQLSGNQGYAASYTGADTAVVFKTGTANSYHVTVNPDVNFGAGELIVVTINVNDAAGNSLAPPDWSFTAASTPIWQTPASIYDFQNLDSPGNLIDDNLGTGNGFGAGGPDHYATFKLNTWGDAYTVTDVRLFGNAIYTSTWDVYVSSDGTNFTQVGSWSVGGGNQWYEYTLPTPAAAVYIQINDRHGGPQQADAVFEFDFRGIP